MFLLQFLELLVDDFCFWPTSVLFDIFFSPPTIEARERIASFAYGNGIPLRVLSRFLRLFNPEWSDESYTHLYALYHMWKLESSAIHRSTYYKHTQDEFVLNGDEAAATNRESGTSRGLTITRGNYVHQRVVSSSRRQDSSAAGPRRSSSAFWRQISLYQYLRRTTLAGAQAQ